MTGKLSTESMKREFMMHKVTDLVRTKTLKNIGPTKTNFKPQPSQTAIRLDSYNVVQLRSLFLIIVIFWEES